MLSADQDHTEFLHLTLPAQPAHLRTLRQHVRRCVATLPISPDRQAETILAVDEAAANAVQHAYDVDHPGSIELTIWTESNALCIQVFDNGHWREPPLTPRPPGHGLGITLMRRLVDCVLIQRGPRGTNVLLRSRITDPAPDHAEPSPRRRPRHARHRAVTEHALSRSRPR